MYAPVYDRSTNPCQYMTSTFLPGTEATHRGWDGEYTPQHTAYVLLADMYLSDAEVDNIARKCATRGVPSKWGNRPIIDRAG